MKGHFSIIVTVITKGAEPSVPRVHITGVSNDEAAAILHQIAESLENPQNPTAHSSLVKSHGL